MVNAHKYNLLNLFCNKEYVYVKQHENNNNKNRSQIKRERERECSYASNCLAQFVRRFFYSCA